ncbi:MAG: ATP-binding cassette domain-containing protein [Acetobacteraceae bacterium]|nr:ATP-binding cassette domain-containing protein [Acetobacteraceae bacterium]
MSRLMAENLVRRFPGTVAVDRVSLSVAAGQALGLMGPNGAGKTTLLDLLSGSGRPDQGRVLLDGRDITRLPAYLRARLGVARTVQRPAWFASLTVLENVMLGTRARARLDGRAARRRALEELDEVGLLRLAHHPGGEASSAERKLGELARVAAMDPTVVLLDEPSAGHDHESLKVLVQSVRRWVAWGAAVLLVDHDRRLVEEVCPVVLRMREGRLVDGAEG